MRVLKQAEVEVPEAELIRQVGSERTLGRWKKQYTTPETDLDGNVMHSPVLVGKMPRATRQ